MRPRSRTSLLPDGIGHAWLARVDAGGVDWNGSDRESGGCVGGVRVLTGSLTTHVLDTAAGQPAAGLTIALYRLGDGAPELLLTAVTNADGRLDAPALAGAAMQPGVYELVFKAGDYLRRRGVALTEPPFLDDVPIRFGIADPEAHYHVPLLLSPYGYSTYRGS
jgi:5-hydroxyisourate hydrolase